MDEEQNPPEDEEQNPPEDENSSETSNDEGIGMPKKGRKKGSASSSKATVSASTKKLTPLDDEWPKDIGDYHSCMKSWNDNFRPAMHQGKFFICWAVALTRCIEAILRMDGRRVELSPQHLVNNIRNKNSNNGILMNYIEVTKFLKQEGLVLESECPFTGRVNENCFKPCQISEKQKFRIQNLRENKRPKEKDVIELVIKGPVLGVIAEHKILHNYEGEIYEGPISDKDVSTGLHVIIITGFGTTSEGVHYWTFQNSWGTNWKENGFSKMIRQSSRGNKPSLLHYVIELVV